MDQNLVVIRLARTIGYALFSINELILTEAQEALAAASSNSLPDPSFFVCKWEEKTIACSECSYCRNKFMTHVSKKNNYLKYLCSVEGEMLRV